MKKQFLRVKQIADQTFLRAEKTEVLTEDLVNAEKRVEAIRISCQTTQKKIASCQTDFGSEPLIEKRLKKLPQIVLATSMFENSNSFAKASVLGDTLRECASMQTKLGNEQLEYFNEVDKSILKPISSVLENEAHNIRELRKKLGKLVLDMDSARTRFQTAERHSLQTSNTGINSMGKVDTLKDELEEASQKVDQTRDALAAEMFSLISKEPQLAKLLVHFHQLQANYHRNVLAALEESIPFIQNQIADFPQKPVYGCSLEEHLRVTDRQIAVVIETCVLFLQEFAIMEEGLFRIAGSASKLKKLKSAFDAGIDIDLAELVRDPHAVSGALKSYLRELPEPLMTFSLYDEWMNAAKIQDFDVKLQSLWQVLRKLPETNFCNLQYVIKFLARLNENAETNKMSSQNIAIVMAPNLLWSPTEDSNATFGMNMSTASLHTAIIDMLINYADWFFPETENPVNIKLKPSCSAPNLNTASNLSQDQIEENDLEINGNNLQVTTSSNPDPMTCSPRTLHRLTKKTAAPPPPAQKLTTSCDRKEDSVAIPTAELITFSSIEKTDDSNTCPKAKVSKDTTEASTAVIRRKSNENIVVSNADASRSEKPVIPDKPSSYSTYSLDRRSQRPQSVRFTGTDAKIMESMSRSQIERPTVPPPERPAKPSRFASTENLSDKMNVNVSDCINGPVIQPQPKSSLTSTAQDTSLEPSNLVNLESKENLINHELKEKLYNQELKEKLVSQEVRENLIDPVPTAKPEHTPVAIQPPRSSAKVNRFDFLVSQGTDRPPERPPRSSVQQLEPSERVAHEEVLPPSKSLSESSEGSITMSPPAIERSKPPRPQPPVPAKPKLNAATENTSL